MDIHFNAAWARFEEEKVLWAEAWQREVEMLDEVLAPWGYRKRSPTARPSATWTWLSRPF